MRLQAYKLNAVFFKTNFRRLFFGSFLLAGLLLSGFTSANAQTKVVRKTNQAISQTMEAERILSSLGYWITKVDNVADASTRHAITAFQKVEGRKRTGILNGAEMQALRNASRPQPRSKGGTTHIEVDLSRQVLFFVNEDGWITHILPVSSGNEKRYRESGKWQIAHTPRGNFSIIRRINGVRHAPLGSLYYPSYFTGGVAIHGSNSIPAFPASHGCVRIPNFAAKAFFNMVSLGMPVMVYD